ncbi:hypothetical protein [Altererythrobacter sp. GH1-8]|uniref:hypothetical protein n=1 Tax=Altererythrobacter sp. GH1-8 TaxID=3349333 RepID=UPI00374CFE4F
MSDKPSSTIQYVIKAEDLRAINYLAPDHPRPRSVEWINRGTDQTMRPTTTAMLMRTLYKPTRSPSVQKLHDSAGLRVVFRSEQDREAFASAFRKACQQEQVLRDDVICAMFDSREAAEKAIGELREVGIPAKAISLLFRASQFMDTDAQWPEGHSPLSIAGAIAGGGVAGALVGIGVLLVPGVGPVAAGGAIAASALSSMASVSGVIGATGGALAKMLTDHDVDGVTAAQYDDEIRRGKVFLSVDTRIAGGMGDTAARVMEKHGGRAGHHSEANQPRALAS